MLLNKQEHLIFIVFYMIRLNAPLYNFNCKTRFPTSVAGDLENSVETISEIILRIFEFSLSRKHRTVILDNGTWYYLICTEVKVNKLLKSAVEGAVACKVVRVCLIKAPAREIYIFKSPCS